MRTDETVYYREVQRFRQIWLWAIVIAIDILMVSTFSYDFYQRIFWEERLMSQCPRRKRGSPGCCWVLCFRS